MRDGIVKDAITPKINNEISISASVKPCFLLVKHSKPLPHKALRSGGGGVNALCNCLCSSFEKFVHNFFLSVHSARFSTSLHNALQHYIYIIPIFYNFVTPFLKKSI